MTPITSLVVLRDLQLKVKLPSDLAQEARTVAERPQNNLATTEWTGFVDEALRVAERCLAFLDAEAARLTEQRFALADPNALRQRLLVDPRRQAELIISQIKQKFSAEKQEWQRRIARQQADVAASMDSQVESIKLAKTLEKDAVVISPDPNWQDEFNAWKRDVIGRWAEHLSPLLRTKTVQLIQSELVALGALLDEPLKIELPVPPALPVAPVRGESKRFEERYDAPSAMETFFEIFKGNLSTVAMLAGMVIVPVIGSLMHEASTEIRAIIMGAAVAPILVFAIYRARSQRKKLVHQSSDKARERLVRAVSGEAKADFERFKPDAEKYITQYCSDAQQLVLSVAERTMQRVFETRERAAVAELARAQLSTEQLQDALSTLRQLRSSIASQLIVDLKRRRADLAMTS